MKLIWGSCFNSRHPDPRRVWRWAPSRISWHHFAGSSGSGGSRGSGGVFQKRRSDRYTRDFVAHEVPSFKNFWKAATRDPKAPQGQPKGAQGRPKASQRGPKAAPGTTKGAQWRPTGVQGRPMAPQKELQGDLYTSKLPLNRPSGRYVMQYICIIPWYKCIIC